MLGADRAESMLRGAAHPAAPRYKEVPNNRSFFTDFADSEIVFFRDTSGTHPTQYVVSKHKGPWTLKLSKFQLVNGSLGKNGVEHSRVSCARARQEGFELTGKLVYGEHDFV